jgi:hypothetical protein
LGRGDCEPPPTIAAKERAAESLCHVGLYEDSYQSDLHTARGKG